jgi:hypothetical protein
MVVVVVAARSPLQFLYRGENHLHDWKLGRVTLVVMMVVMLLMLSAIHHHRARGSSTSPNGTVQDCKLVLAINDFFGNVGSRNAWSVLQSHGHC